MDDELTRRSEAYIDGLFGEASGARHTRFLEHIECEPLREALHRYHVLEQDTEHVSVEENYLIGMCVLCAQRHYGPASMFAKTLLHLGVSRNKVLGAIGRLQMWVGGIPAAEAAAHIQKAVRDYEKNGVASLASWFPEEG